MTASKRMKKKNVTGDSAPSDDDDYEYVTIPPDGGYGWVVAFACMMCNLIVDGVLYAFSVIKLPLQDYFGVGEGLILLVGSLCCGVYMTFGPLYSAAANRFGCRAVIMFGSFLTGISMALSIFSKNVYAMLVMYGIIAGFGFGLVYLPSVVMVGFYFDKKRSLATGLTVAGTGIGVLSFGQLAGVLFDNLGWKGGMLILSGIMMNCAVFGALMKPVKPTRVKKLKTEKEMTGLSKEKEAEGTSPKKVSDVDEKNKFIGDAEMGDTERSAISEEDAQKPMYRQDIFIENLENVKEFVNKKDAVSYIQSTTSIDKAGRNRGGLSDCCFVFKTMLRLELLLDPQIFLLCMAQVFGFFGYYLVMMLLVTVAEKQIGVAPIKARMTMTALGILNTLARLGFGMLGSSIPGSALHINNVTLTLCAIFSFLFPFFKTYLHIMLYSCMFGVFTAPFVGLTPVFTCDIVGLQLYTSTVGLIFLFRGVSCVLGPSIGGLLADATGSFVIPFMVAAATLFVCAILHLLVPFAKNFRMGPFHSRVVSQSK